MKSKAIRWVFLLAILGLSVTAVAQMGYPLGQAAERGLKPATTISLSGAGDTCVGAGLR